jgi:hypothetical protein
MNMEERIVKHLSNYKDGELICPVKRIQCMDGFNISVQANYGAYCYPRNNGGYWSKVELGYPSEKEEEIMPYIYGNPMSDPVNNVYGYVPIAVIAGVLTKHGAPNI